MYHERYYTPHIVRRWLERYPALALAVQYGTGLAEGDLNPGSGRMNQPLFAPRPLPGVDPHIDPRYYRSPSRSGRVHDLLSTAMAVKVDLDRGIKRLPERERAVIVLRYIEEWTVREVATEMRVSYGRIQQISTKGVHKIAATLGYTQ